MFAIKLLNTTLTTVFQHNYLSVKIIGHNKVYISSSIVKISHDTNSNYIYLAWIGLVFISDTNHANSSIYHGYIRSVTILNCNDCFELFINDNEFGQVDICPTVLISTLSSFVQEVRFIFSNNNY